VFVLSSLFNDPVYYIVGVFCEITTGENRVGSKRRGREREREREWQINGVMMERWTEMEMAWAGNGR
jgi:hypothetical protein